jgi:hypothetical protein
MRKGMTIDVDGVVEDEGVIKPTRPLGLRKKTRVHLTIEVQEEPATTDEDPTGWKTARRFIGLWKGASKGEPVAREHDKHLYK